MSVDSTVTGTKLPQLQAVLAKLSSDAIYGGPYRCLLGFNVNRPDTSETCFLTARSPPAT